MMGESEAESPLGAPSMSPMRTGKPCSPSEHSISLMVILAAIGCALLCALGLNTMLQCVFQCANRVLTEPFQWIASRRLNSGLKKTEVVALPTSTYTHSGGSPCNCAICLSEFSDGDSIRFLPNCNHRFHVHCIDKWLFSHSSCPTCRTLLKSTHSLHSFHVIVS